jgi:hypothetical protein
MMRRKSWEHTTRDEINYLKNIGSFSLHSGGELELLNKYRSSTIDRVEWGDIKKEVVIDFVDKRIKKLGVE